MNQQDGWIWLSVPTVVENFDQEWRRRLAYLIWSKCAQRRCGDREARADNATVVQVKIELLENDCRELHGSYWARVAEELRVLGANFDSCALGCFVDADVLQEIGWSESSFFRAKFNVWRIAIPSSNGQCKMDCSRVGWSTDRHLSPVASKTKYCSLKNS